MMAMRRAELRGRTRLTLGTLVIALLGLVLTGWATGSLLLPHVDAFDAGGAARVAMTGGTAVDVWTGVSWLGSGVVVVVAGLVLCAVLVRRRCFDLVTIVALGVIGPAALSSAVKLLVNRPRPALGQVAASGPSFPSGHATQAAAFYGVLIALAVLLPIRDATRLVAIGLCTAVMLAVAYSRLALGVHFPTDVIAGLLLGGTWAALTVAAVRPRRDHEATRSGIKKPDLRVPYSSPAHSTSEAGSFIR